MYVTCSDVTKSTALYKLTFCDYCHISVSSGADQYKNGLDFSNLDQVLNVLMKIAAKGRKASHVSILWNPDFCSSFISFFSPI